MINSRTIGLNHIYFDKNIDGYSNLAVGIFIRSLGHGLRVCYVDVSSGATKFINFLENLSLSKSFTKSFNRINSDIFTFKKNGMLSKSIIPEVEFSMITKQMFLNSIRNYDILIFDNCDLEKFSEKEICNILKNKNQLSEIIFTFSEEKIYNKLKKYFEIETTYDYKKQSNLFSNSKIVDITGYGRGKSLFSFGYIIRNFIAKKDVKLIYFDKDEFYYGEMNFFKALKNWSKLNNLYGSFDFVITGFQRHFGLNFRQENVKEDYFEAKEALMLLKTAIKKQTPVIADELNTVISKGLIDKSEVLEILKQVENELLITGSNSHKEILNIASTIIEVKEIKELKNIGVKLGIDF